MNGELLFIQRIYLKKLIDVFELYHEAQGNNKTIELSIPKGYYPQGLTLFVKLFDDILKQMLGYQKPPALVKYRTRRSKS